jgi:uncharacterized protein (DUF1330 family)
MPSASARMAFHVLLSLACAIAITMRPVDAWSATPEPPCATAGYLVALQGIGGAASPFEPEWEPQIRASGGTYLVDESPTRVYEGPPDWGRVTVVRWRCFEEAEAVWKTLPPPKQVGQPALLRTAALYRGGNYPDFPETMRRLPPGCVTPAFFMAVNTTLDEDKYAGYRKAMRETDYVQRLGSTTLFTGQPVATLAGWPPSTAASMTRWPCSEAFHLFYFDKTYEETIKPLRAGAIDYRILGFDDADRPRRP